MDKFCCEVRAIISIVVTSITSSLLSLFSGTCRSSQQTTNVQNKISVWPRIARRLNFNCPHPLQKNPRNNNQKTLFFFFRRLSNDRVWWAFFVAEDTNCSHPFVSKIAPQAFFELKPPTHLASLVSYSWNARCQTMPKNRPPPPPSFLLLLSTEPSPYFKSRSFYFSSLPAFQKRD